ncbi:hypothetical protein EA462_10620 [Natrarchaeobius halalkaliphilus]|uniref:DUF8139 domain-containing protein n=1 Tax=Natrarchaeobius halalkaliphilus TaxID=1679091 RepID=A0A3N6P290_9EURY|nr:hypothetical protein [Natrarchaeobius halalkaliphilus]RQG89265.1 hypothetical protein EA462_10620 [Natrarchaeobius halalkaliphilus]
MRRFEVGDRVRIDIPDKGDPDFELYHDRKGEVVDLIEDDADAVTGDVRDSYLFAVEFGNGEIEHFRWRDLRPVPEK